MKELLESPAADLTLPDLATAINEHHAAAEKAQRVARLSLRQAVHKISREAKNRREYVTTETKPPKPSPSYKRELAQQAAFHSRITRVSAEHPDWAEQREEIAKLYGRLEEVNDEYCRVQDELGDLEEDLKTKAERWCKEHPEGAPG